MTASWNKLFFKQRCFSSCQERGKKFWFPKKNRTSDLRIPRSYALPLSHRDSTASEVYYEVHTARVLHTSRISNVDSVMLVNSKFWARWRNRVRCFFVLSRAWDKEKVLSPHEKSNPRPSDCFFLCPTLVTRRKTSFSLSLFELKTYHLSFLFTNNFLSSNSQNIFFQFAP